MCFYSKLDMVKGRKAALWAVLAAAVMGAGYTYREDIVNQVKKCANWIPTNRKIVQNIDMFVKEPIKERLKYDKRLEDDWKETKQNLTPSHSEHYLNSWKEEGHDARSLEKISKDVFYKLRNVIPGNELSAIKEIKKSVIEYLPGIGGDTNGETAIIWEYLDHAANIKRISGLRNDYFTLEECALNEDVRKDIGDIGNAKKDFKMYLDKIVRGESIEEGILREEFEAVSRVVANKYNIEYDRMQVHEDKIFDEIKEHYLNPRNQDL